MQQIINGMFVTVMGTDATSKLYGINTAMRDMVGYNFKADVVDKYCIKLEGYTWATSDVMIFKHEKISTNDCKEYYFDEKQIVL